jgi:hypothetical protein
MLPALRARFAAGARASKSPEKQFHGDLLVWHQQGLRRFGAAVLRAAVWRTFGALLPQVCLRS